MAEQNYKLKSAEVKFWRKIANLTLEQLAEKCEVHPKTLAKWLRGEPVRPANVDALVKVLGCKKEAIVQEKEKPSYVLVNVTFEVVEEDFEENYVKNMIIHAKNMLYERLPKSAHLRIIGSDQQGLTYQVEIRQLLCEAFVRKLFEDPIPGMTAVAFKYVGRHDLAGMVAKAMDPFPVLESLGWRLKEKYRKLYIEFYNASDVDRHFKYINIIKCLGRDHKRFMRTTIPLLTLYKSVGQPDDWGPRDLKLHRIVTKMADWRMLITNLERLAASEMYYIREMRILMGYALNSEIDEWQEDLKKLEKKIEGM